MSWFRIEVEPVQRALGRKGWRATVQPGAAGHFTEPPSFTRVSKQTATDAAKAWCDAHLAQDSEKETFYYPEEKR